MQIKDILGKGRGLALAVYHTDENYGLHMELPYLFSMHLPLFRSRKAPEDMYESWGVNWMNGPDWGFFSPLYLKWGKLSKFIYMPWSWEWYRTSYLMPNGQSWAHTTYRDRKKGLKALDQTDAIPKWEEVYPYRYVRKNGEVQERLATVQVHEMEHRWLWFRWLPFPRRINRYIDFQFNGEVGEESGSWKGGVIGSSYTMLPNELASDCLRRMECNRKF